MFFFGLLFLTLLYRRRDLLGLFFQKLSIFFVEMVDQNEMKLVFALYKILSRLMFEFFWSKTIISNNLQNFFVKGTLK